MKASPRSAKPAAKRPFVLYATLAVIAIGLIAAVGFASRVPKAATEVRQQAQIKVGQPAPPFDVSTTAGPFNLASASTPVFLEVFATWCPHCQREVPVIDALAKKYTGKVSFVGVAGSAVGMDGNAPESQADVIAFTQKFGVTYPIAYDPGLKVANAYLQTGFPTVVIIKKNKTISYVADGEITKDVLDKAIAAAL